MQHGCWCQIGQFEYFGDYLSTGIEWSEKQKLCSELWVSGQKYLVNVRGETTQINTGYNDMQICIPLNLEADEL